jgi:hypothetical protein
MMLESVSQQTLSFPPSTKAFEGRLRREPIGWCQWRVSYGFPPARERQGWLRAFRNQRQQYKRLLSRTKV